ncbi:MAG: hypothetical protein ACTSQB_00250, partial [Candidatus Heimdallarchaeota archaeon]
FKDGSLDKACKSIASFYGMNVKEAFYVMGVEYNIQNMREFNEEMERFGFSYSGKKIKGVVKKCFWLSMKKKGTVLQMVDKK